jgi:transcriptional regulator with XRE-family HTH domain
MFPALLRYWRGRRGLSQLDLALLAEVSARHLSFLESGRAKPSLKMVLRLMTALDAPLRDQNAVLEAAGFEPRFADLGLDGLSLAVDQAMERMLVQHEPYPLTLLSADYRILRSNRAARQLFQSVGIDPARLTAPLDMFSLLFDPTMARPYVIDWPRVAGRMLARLHRETLRSGGDERLLTLLARALSYPDVRPEWRQPDFSASLEPVLEIWLRWEQSQIGFLTTLTAFSAPGVIILEELRIESYFPLDGYTREVCERRALQDSRDI